tara:strand:+ start:708 stop:926 length:219 start_codon:yes stop_codon:yes gene_type:complete
MDANELGDLLLEFLPPDGTSMGNQAAHQALSKAAEREVGEEEYDQIKDKLSVVSVLIESCKVRADQKLPLVE